MWRSFLVVAAALLATGVSAEIVQGRDYRSLAPARPALTEAKVEVLEFFSYACPHCAHFHPSVTKWASELPKDTAFVRVPVSFGRQQWGQLARAYYALQSMGELERFDAALFKAIHEERKPLFNEQNLSAWIAEQGGDAAKFREAFNSFSVTQSALRADQLSRDYQVSGVPQLTVEGKYTVLGDTFADVLRIATELVEKEHAGVKSASTE
jgi:thiol:disulfide interchange protein DsbA